MIALTGTWLNIHDSLLLNNLLSDVVQIKNHLKSCNVREHLLQKNKIATVDLVGVQSSSGANTLFENFINRLRDNDNLHILTSRLFKSNSLFGNKSKQEQMPLLCEECH